MKTLLLTFVALVLILSARGGQQEQTADVLLKNIRAALPEGWTTSFDQEHSWLAISRDKAVLSSSALPNSPPFEKPEPSTFRFAFRVAAAISPAEFRRLSAENTKIRTEAIALYDDLLKRRVPHKFDSFAPRTDLEKADVALHEALKKSLHSLPDFYFRDISLRWQLGAPDAPAIIIADDKIREEYKRVQEKVVNQLAKYENSLIKK